MKRPSALVTAAFALAALAMLLLAGCAGTRGGKHAVPGQAQAFWDAIKAPEAPNGQVRSFSLSASLSLQSPNKSARLQLKFWGDLERPLRLDLSTSLGQTFSMQREDSLGWIAVYPLSNQAFTHADTRAALSRLGMPFPFGFKDLAALSLGRIGSILPTAYKSVKNTSKGYEYTLAAPSTVASLTLDFEGKPIHLTGRGVEPWTVDFGDFNSPEQGGKPHAQRIQVTSPGGLQAILRIKKLETGPDPMPADTLELPLPPAARHIFLDRPGEVSAPDLP